MRKVILIAVAVLVVAVFVGRWITFGGGDPRTRAEREHGITLYTYWN